ncbi:hypothetical protein [Actinomyces weissii]|uniref:Uncharacterized protein n=1 Tax=Actinomyces weissii TaxID=675090 RepID=A0A7T7MA32_9ACTO|nr:hypothetical protein [Actinomyces weissii]QQM67706.1 hypothetical protein JG540_02160 [Actinomyces weissii]
MTTWFRRLALQDDCFSVSVVLRRLLGALGAAASAGALLCGATALPVAQAAQPAAGGLEDCPADTFCVDGVARQVVDRVPDLSLGEGQPGAFALVPGDSLRPAFAVQNLGSQPVAVVVRMDWRNDRCTGQSFAQDPHLSGLPHPGGQTRFYSPGMRAAVEYGGSRLTAESLRCTGSTQTSQITMSPGERLDFQGLVDFPFDSNLNDTQRERVWLGFSIQVAAQDLDPAPGAPAGPGQTGSGSSQGSGAGWLGRPGAPGRPGLAVTGVDLLGVGVGVGGLLLLGGLLLAWRRRRGGQEGSGQ